MNSIVESYSHLALQYDEDSNSQSCWAIAAEKALASIHLKQRYLLVADVGCGSGRALRRLASQGLPNAQLVGIEPALNMRSLAVELTREYPPIRIVDGSFEHLPFESDTVDYVYSIFAFHWTTDLERSVSELHRVLKKDGEMDLFFIGRNNGQEFIRNTTPIFLKYMGAIALLRSAAMRQQLTRDAAYQLFQKRFGEHKLSVEDSYHTYWDTLEGHWNWWVRIEGHFLQIPPEKRSACDREVKRALATLQTDAGIPYTIHLLHVKVRSG